MSNQNPHRSVVLTEELSNSLNRYAAQNNITGSQAIRHFIEQGLSLETYKQHQTEIRKYIREELENTLAVVIKPYMERLIKIQVNGTRSSAASLMATVAVLSENYIDTATPEEILANSLKLATQITKTKPKSDDEYLAEAKQWLYADLSKSNDS